MTASIHKLTPPSAGLPDDSAERLRDAARALSRMGPSMARSIDVVSVDGPVPLIGVAAARIAATFDLVATVQHVPLLTVRFERPLLPPR
ncbi:MAG TPA: hypothetical protein VGS17_03610 [Candidatus Limnocylindria bacterium]|nr:hypothetical protein [Candidatus Limnocylindria bacterium]